MKEVLPQYEPHDNVWQKINAELNKDSALNNLPFYDPPQKVWDRINRKLNAGKYTLWISAAACVLVVFGLGYYYNMTKTTILYSNQTIEMIEGSRLSLKNQIEYKKILKVCEVKLKTCENPEFLSLKNELDDLNTAAEQLKMAIGKYNTEPLLATQLQDIESQKNEIIKKMSLKI